MLAFLAFSFCFPFLWKVWDGVIWKKDMWGLFWDHTQWHVEMGERWVTIPWAGPAHRFWLAGWWRWRHCRSWQFGARCAVSCPSRFESLSCWHGNRAAGGLAAVGTCSPSRGGSEGFLRLRDGQKKVIYIFNRHSQQCTFWLALLFSLRALCCFHGTEGGQSLPSLNENLYQEQRNNKRDTEIERDRMQVSAIQDAKNEVMSPNAHTMESQHLYSTSDYFFRWSCVFMPNFDLLNTVVLWIVIIYTFYQGKVI